MDSLEFDHICYPCKYSEIILLFNDETLETCKQGMSWRMHTDRPIALGRASSRENKEIPRMIVFSKEADLRDFRFAPAKRIEHTQ